MQWMKVWGHCLIWMSLTCCGATLDTTRVVKDQTLGEASYEILCRRVAFLERPEDPSVAWATSTCKDGAMPPIQAGAQLLALSSQRQPIIDTIDTWLSPDVAQDLQDLVKRLLPMVDDGQLAILAQSSAQTLDALMADDEALVAIAHWMRDENTQPVADDFWQAFFSYSGYANIQTQLIQQVQKAYVSYVEPLRVRMAQKNQYKRSQIASHESLDTLPLIDFLLSPIKPSISNQSPIWIAARDTRGLLIPASIDGQFIEPFVDLNRDSLADVDSHGMFVNAYGQPITPLKQPFVSCDLKNTDSICQKGDTRARDANHRLVYEYFDASQTVVAALLEQVTHVFTEIESDKKELGHVGGSRLEEETVPQITDDSAFWDIMQAGMQIFAQLDTSYLVEKISAYLAEAQSDLASWVGFFQDAKQWLDADGVDLRVWFAENGDLFFEDISILLEKIANQDGLILDVFNALTDARTWDLGPLLAQQMRYSDAIDFDITDINAPATGEFLTPAKTVGAQTAAQQSIFTRLLNLIADANQKGLCSAAIEEPFPTYAPCELFQIDNTAVFYTQALANRAVFQMRMRVDDFFFPEQLTEAKEANPSQSEMEAFTGIVGFETLAPQESTDATQNFLSFRVTPQAAARLLFSMYDERIDPNSEFGMTRAAAQMVTPRLFVEQQPFDVLHRGTLFAWEKDDFFTAVQPLLQAFAKHEREDLLIDGLLLLQKFWQPEKNGLAQMEPWLATVLAEGRLFERLGQSLKMWQRVAKNTDLSILAQQAQSILASKQKSPAVRTGDKRQIQKTFAPLEFLRRAWPQIHVWLNNASSVDTQVAQRVLQQMFEVKCDDGNYTFNNTQAFAIAQKGFAFLTTQLANADVIADPAAWAYAKTQAFRESTGPLWISLGATLWSDETLRSELFNFVGHVLRSAPQDTLTQTIAALQFLQDGVHRPVLQHHLQQAFAANQGLVVHLAGSFATATKQDQKQVLPCLLRRASELQHRQSVPRRLGSIFAQVQHATEKDKASSFAERIGRMLAASKAFLTDTAHGIPRLVDVIKGRHACTES